MEYEEITPMSDWLREAEIPVEGVDTTMKDV